MFSAFLKRLVITFPNQLAFTLIQPFATLGLHFLDCVLSSGSQVKFYLHLQFVSQSLSDFLSISFKFPLEILLLAVARLATTVLVSHEQKG